MANENDDIKKEGAEHEAHKHHTSWLGNIIDKIQDLDTDFPLSGGEEDPRPAHHAHHPEKKTEPNAGDANQEGHDEKEKPEHHTSFIRHIIDEIEHKIENLDTDFPLSGGEENVTYHLPHLTHKDKEGSHEEGKA